MNKKSVAVIISLAMMTSSSLTLPLDTLSVHAGTLVSRSTGASVSKDKKQIVIDYLKKSFKKDRTQMGRSPKFQIDTIMSTDKWFTAGWMITSRENPNGWAGSLLFKKEQEQWIYKLGVQTFEGSQKELMSVGMTPEEAKFFSSKPDV